MIKKNLIHSLSFLFCLAMLLPMCSCGMTKNSNSGNDTDINFTAIGSNETTDKEDNINDGLADGTISDVYSLVCSAVTQDLMSAGFTCGTGVASTAEKNDFSSIGLYYYDPKDKFYEEDDLRAVGFVEILAKGKKAYSHGNDNDTIVVMDVNDLESDVYNVYSYNYENIGTYHFIYKNRYVTYYQESDVTVRYTVQDNVRANYDLTLGSLYDYDNSLYVYDESIFGEYKTHSGVELFGEKDYAQLEKQLQAVSKQQEENGYSVNEYNIVYISPESIQAYLTSEEKDTFFGYNVDELTAQFGLGTALTYTENGFVKSTVIEPTDNDYNWKSFLIKCGIGCGIILVGAILTPLTGGASFGCALLTITKIALSTAITQGLGTLVIQTVVGLIEGKDLSSAIKDATYAGLDAFANGFMIGAAIGSVGVVSGVIKPTACFVAGTPIMMSDGTYLPIESVAVGCSVLSFNDLTHQLSKQTVTDDFQKEVYNTVRISIGGEVIETTENHPFYDPIHSCWRKAGSLHLGDYVTNANGELRMVEDSEVVYHNSPVTVYNFTVENTHTYFAGNTSVLVHNECTTLQSKRNKAVSDAWKREREAVINGTSKYKWTKAQKTQLIITGRVNGFEGAHIVDVNRLVGTVNESWISNPDNIIFLTHKQHLIVHGGFYKNATNILTMIKFRPQFAEQILKVAGILA